LYGGSITTPLEESQKDAPHVPIFRVRNQSEC
jgi:hypothetical protein